MTRLLCHPVSHTAPCPQSLRQQHRSRGCLHTRRHPQGDADHQPQARRRPSMFAFVSAPADKKANTLWQPIMHHFDISCPCVSQRQRQHHYLLTPHSMLALKGSSRAALKGSAVTSLKCAPAPVPAFLSTPLDTWPSPIAVCSTTRLAMAPTPSCLSPPRCRRSSPSAASSPSRRTSTSHTAASMLRMRSCSRLTCQGTRVSGRSSAPPAHEVFAFVSAPVDTALLPLAA